MAITKIILTEEQARPLDVLGASVALRAGAGCGKTTVLTARFLRELEGPDRKPLAALAALTFTEKAARELRARIRAQCRARIQAGVDVGHWRGVLRALEAAPIGTFHEFCGQWLRRQAVDARIDPDFQILDATIAGSVRDEALGRCVRGWLAEGNADLIDLAAEFGMRATREALDELIGIRAGGDLAGWINRSADQVIDIWRTEWDEQTRPALFASVTRASRATCELLEAHPLDHPKLHAHRAALLRFLPKADAWLDESDSLRLSREMALLPRGLRSNHWPSPQINEAVKDQLKSFRDAVDNYLSACEWSEEVSREAAEYGLRFARLARDARGEYDRAKQKRGALDFDDLLLKMHGVLDKIDESARAALAGPLELLLVDEFQDTDPVQSDILQMLSGAGQNTGRLFLVGDAKQSIYRFRGAEPTIFQDFHAGFPEKGRLDLSENFRSVPEILTFVNALFKAEPGFQNQELKPRPDVTALDDCPAITFVWATEPDPGAKPNAREARKAEARWLARYLRARLDAGWPIRDPKTRTNEIRPAHAGDIAFLLRALTDVSAYEAALQEEGLEHYTIGGSAFYAQQEVIDLIDLLATLEDPFDAVALAGALRSPFFCLTDDALFWLSGPTGAGDLAGGLLDPARVERLTESDRWLADRARQMLERWRGLKDRVSIASLVDRVLDESGYEAALLGERFGARKRANARKLVRMARSFDQQGGFTLADFVARLRADLREPPREEQAATSDDEAAAVRLMSIHQAKGLEFPIVVLPDLNRKSPMFSKPVAFDPKLGPLVRLSKEEDDDAGAVGESLGSRIFRAREQREDDAEALRLFYVAATRARDALLLSSALRVSEAPRAPAMKLLAARFDLESGRSLHETAGSEPRIVVVRTEPETTGVHTPAQAGWSRSRMREVADLIAATEMRADADSTPDPRRPRFIDLDPRQGLPPTVSRFDRLVRAILADPRAWRPRDLPAVVRGAARKLSLPPSSTLIAEAMSLLGPWLSGPIGRLFSEPAQVERDVAWALVWPPENPSGTVWHGRINLAVHDPDGGCRIVNFATSLVPETRERLRVMLSARATEALGLGPIRQGWRIRIGPTEFLPTEEDCRDRAAIDATVRTLSRIDLS